MCMTSERIEILETTSGTIRTKGESLEERQEIAETSETRKNPRTTWNIIGTTETLAMPARTAGIAWNQWKGGGTQTRPAIETRYGQTTPALPLLSSILRHARVAHLSMRAALGLARCVAFAPRCLPEMVVAPVRLHHFEIITVAGSCVAVALRNVTQRLPALRSQCVRVRAATRSRCENPRKEEYP